MSNRQRLRAASAVLGLALCAFWLFVVVNGFGDEYQPHGYVTAQAIIGSIGAVVAIGLNIRRLVLIQRAEPGSRTNSTGLGVVVVLALAIWTLLIFILSSD